MRNVAGLCEPPAEPGAVEPTSGVDWPPRTATWIGGRLARWLCRSGYVIGKVVPRETIATVLPSCVFHVEHAKRVERLKRE